MSSWANNPFNPYRLPPRVTPDMLISDRNGLTGQPLRPEDDQPDDGTATSSVGIPSAGTSAPYDLSAMNPQPRVRPTPPPQPEPPPQAQMPPQVTPQMMGDQSSSGPQNRVTVQPSGFGLPDESARGTALRAAQAPFQAPERPKSPSTWRAILAGLAGATNLGHNFAPLIAYGPKGLAQEREYEQYQQNLPQQLKAGDLAGDVYRTDANEKLRQTTQDSTDAYRKTEEQRKQDEDLQKFTSAPNYGQLVDAGAPLPQGYTRTAGYAPPGQYRAQPTAGKLKEMQTEAAQVGWKPITKKMVESLPELGLTEGDKFPEQTWTKLADLAKGKTPTGGEIALGPRVDQINKAMTARYQVLHPGAALPDHYLLPSEATQKDFDRTNKLIEGEERAFGTKENHDQTTELRKQTMALAAANREKKDDTALKQAALKSYTPAMDSSERFNVMTKNYEDAVKNHDQQAMLSLLANHLGMTMGLQKGSRLTRDIIREAQQSRPWLQGLTAKFDSQGYLDGVTLTPAQMRQMVTLGRERFAEDISKARNEAKYQGVSDDGPDRTPSKATINFYTALAGGDPRKAKEMASADGWSIK